MKLYIASHCRETARQVKAALIGAGHQITARWIAEDTKFGQPNYSDEERSALAVMDIVDVRRATDGLVLMAAPEGVNVPGGKHVEAGIAIGLNRLVYVIGRQENIFHWHPNVRVFDDVSALLLYLERHPGAGKAKSDEKANS